MSQTRVGASAGDEKYLVSLRIDLNARTVKVEGHSSVPIKGPVDEDVVVFASPKTVDDVLNGSVNRITGEALIYFLSNPVFEFRGRVPPCPIAVLDPDPLASLVARAR